MHIQGEYDHGIWCIFKSLSLTEIFDLIVLIGQFNHLISNKLRGKSDLFVMVDALISGSSVVTQ